MITKLRLENALLDEQKAGPTNYDRNILKKEEPISSAFDESDKEEGTQEEKEAKAFDKMVDHALTVDTDVKFGLKKKKKKKTFGKIGTLAVDSEEILEEDSPSEGDFCGSDEPNTLMDKLRRTGKAIE